MNARELAHTILCDVINDGQYANLALKQRLTQTAQVDQSLVTALVYTTLQYHRYLRAAWSDYVDRMPKPKTAVLLDMACAQILRFDRVPDYAIVNETVELCKKLDHGHSAPMVNAVLRKVLAKGRVPMQGTDEVDTFALNHALPTWMVQLWTRQYGPEISKKIATSLLTKAMLSARVNTLMTTLDEVLEDPSMHPGVLSENCVHSDANLVHSEAFKHGKLWLQDEASALVSEFLEAQPGMDVLDVCSAPGSKTAGIACMMENTGSIVAIELHPQRTKLIESLMGQLGISIVKTMNMDARDVTKFLPPEGFDRLLADVPCSGLGVLRRKADIKLRVSPAQLDELEGLQKAILEGVWPMLKVGGILVYSTCTLNKKENEGQIKHFLRYHPDFELISERTIFPFEYGTDGFYMAKLKRNG